MKLMRTQDAVGHMLCHDITQIIKDEKKGPVFRKGHIIREEDVPVLLSVGKDHIYIWENNENMLHEDDAAEVLRTLCQNEHMHASEPKEGKIELVADIDGLLLVDVERLRTINSLGEMMIATRASGFVVRKGEKLAAMRVIPLIIEKEKMERAKEAVGGEPLLKLVPLKAKKVGVVTTGNEVFYGRIQDTFTPRYALEGLRDGRVQRRHERGPRRPHAAGDQEHRREHRLLRLAGAARRDVPRLLYARRAARVRPARLRDVRAAHDLRSAAALSRDGHADHARAPRRARPRRTVPELQGLPLPELRLRQGDMTAFKAQRALKAGAAA